MAGARLLAASTALGVATALVGCPGTLTLEEKQHLAYDCPDVPSVVFARRCAIAGCHDATSAAADLDLDSPKLAERLLGMQAHYGDGALIDLREPDRSVLLTKLSESPPYGARMPEGRPPLDDAAQACVRAWVYAQLPADAGADGATSDAGDVLDAADATYAQDAAAGEVSSSDAAGDG
jgi:hypothetical protein